jgi:hypothetical protein
MTINQKISDVEITTIASNAANGPGDHPINADREPDGPEKGDRPPLESVTLFGLTPLAAGEDSDEQVALLLEVGAAIAPKDFFEKLTVADLTHALWEEQRYRRQQVDLACASRFKALTCLLVPICQRLNLSALKIAADYFGADEKARDEVTSLLLRYGISENAINAQAAQLHAQSMASLDRLVAARQAQRSTVLRQHEQRRRRADKHRIRTSPPQAVSH